MLVTMLKCEKSRSHDESGRLPVCLFELCNVTSGVRGPDRIVITF